MARVYLLSQPRKLLTHLYVVERAVGNGGPNRRDDLLLVQFMLRVLMPPQGSYPSQEVFQPPGQKPLAIDGLWGTQTHAYVKAFQEQFNKAEGPNTDKAFHLREDGAINPLEGGAIFGKRFHQLMTLVRL